MFAPRLLHKDISVLADYLKLIIIISVRKLDVVWKT